MRALVALVNSAVLSASVAVGACSPVLSANAAVARRQVTTAKAQVVKMRANGTDVVDATDSFLRRRLACAATPAVGPCIGFRSISSSLRIFGASLRPISHGRAGLSAVV